MQCQKHFKSYMKLNHSPFKAKMGCSKPKDDMVHYEIEGSMSLGTF